MAYRDKRVAIQRAREYNARSYDRITITVHKGRRAEIQARAREMGTTVNAWIVSLIDKDMADR